MNVREYVKLMKRTAEQREHVEANNRRLGDMSQLETLAYLERAARIRRKRMKEEK